MVEYIWLVVWNHGIWIDFPFSWECHHPNWRAHIFQKVETTNQMRIWSKCWWGQKILLDLLKNPDSHVKHWIQRGVFKMLSRRKLLSFINNGDLNKQNDSTTASDCQRQLGRQQDWAKWGTLVSKQIVIYGVCGWDDPSRGNWHIRMAKQETWIIKVL